LILDEKKKLSTSAKKLEERWDKNLKIAHKIWFLFDAYDDLLNDKVSLDNFLATWDITSTKRLSTNTKTSLDILNSIIEWDMENENNTLFILDAISFWSLANNDKKIIQEWAKNHNSELIFC
jgi:hypothetical protein